MENELYWGVSTSRLSQINACQKTTLIVWFFQRGSGEYYELSMEGIKNVSMVICLELLTMFPQSAPVPLTTSAEVLEQAIPY